MRQKIKAKKEDLFLERKEQGLLRQKQQREVDFNLNYLKRVKQKEVKRIKREEKQQPKEVDISEFVR